jgi:hypothetical protein
MLDVALAEAIEDTWRPESRPDIAALVEPGRWGATPYPCDLFLELLSAAVGYLRHPASFCDIGAGPGTKVELAAARGCRPAWGVEAVDAWAAAGRQLGADIRTGRAEDADLTGTRIVYLNQLYQARGGQAALEDLIRDRMDDGAVLISANYAAPPPSCWLAVMTDPGRWRGVWVKP